MLLLFEGTVLRCAVLGTAGAFLTSLGTVHSVNWTFSAVSLAQSLDRTQDDIQGLYGIFLRLKELSFPKPTLSI